MQSILRGARPLPTVAFVTVCAFLLSVPPALGQEKPESAENPAPATTSETAGEKSKEGRQAEGDEEADEASTDEKEPSKTAEDAASEEETSKDEAPEDEKSESPAKKTDGQPTSEKAVDSKEAEKDRKYPPEVYDPAWARYREAFETLAKDEPHDAAEQLRALRGKYPDHAASVFAGPVLDMLEKRLAEETQARRAGMQPKDEKPEPATGKTDRLGVERPTGLARAELVTFQTMHGIGFGVETCAIVECVGPRPVVASMILGGGVGLGTSLHFSRRGITPGHASVINSGVQWGFWNAAALNGITYNWSNTPAGVVLPLMVGQLGGLGAGVAVWNGFRPNAGDVALVNSAGMWSAAFTGLFIATAGLEPAAGTTAGAFLLSTGLAGLGVGFLASKAPLSRGRVHIINLGGLLGGLTGLGSVVLLGPDPLNPRVGTGATMFGAGGGLAVAALLTKGWSIVDDSDQADAGKSTSLFVRPVREGRGAVLTFGGRF